MINFIEHLLRNFSTYTLGYWPDVFQVVEYENSLTNLSSIIFVYLCLLVVANIVNLLLFYGSGDFQPRATVKYGLIYIAVNILTTFGITFLAWNIFGIVGLMLSCLLVVTHVINVLYEGFDDNSVSGIFNVMAYFKELIRVESEYEKKMSKYNKQYNKLINL